MTALDFQAINRLTGLLRERKDALTIRWLGSTVAIGVFALIIAWFEQGSPRVPLLLTVFVWVASAVLAGLSVWLPRQQLADPHVARRLRLPADAQGWARKMRLTPEQARTLAALPNLEQRLFGLTLLFERPYTLGLAFAGALAVLGLIYGLIAGTLVEASVPLLGALALNCWHYPRLTPLIERGRKLESKAEDEAVVRELTGMTPGHGRRASPSAPPPARTPSVRPPAATPRARTLRKP